MSSAFGADFSGVRVHVGPQAEAIGALAYTRGDDIHFAPDRYDPISPAGQELIGHELTHVLQQRAGRVSAPQGKGIPILADRALEAEADAMGARAARGEPAVVVGAGSAGSAGGGGAIQPKLGFELELQVMLSQERRPSSLTGAPPEEMPGGEKIKSKKGPKSNSNDNNNASDTSEDPWEGLTIDDLAKIDPSLGIRHGRRVLIGEDLYEWDAHSTEEPLDLLFIRPVALKDREPGRWRYLMPTDPSDRMNYQGSWGQYDDPLLEKEEKIFRASAATPFDVVEDHAPPGAIGGPLQSIIELVTDPRSEWDDEETFTYPMLRAAETAKLISGRTNDLTRRIPANWIFPGARPDLFLGYPAADKDSTHQSVNASVQASYGVSLAGIPELFEDMRSDKAPPRVYPREASILEQTGIAAENVMAKLTSGASAGAVARLRGLIHLLELYIVAGHPRYIGPTLDKNNTPLLVRDSMAKMVMRLSKIEDDGARILERHLDDLPSIMAGAMSSDVSTRFPSDPLFSGIKGSPTIATWLREVLSGRSDPMMSVWGLMKPIPPEDVAPPGKGEETAPVMEERQVPPFTAIPGKGNLIRPDDWVPLARSYQERLRRYNRSRVFTPERESDNNAERRDENNNNNPQQKTNDSGPIPDLSYFFKPRTGSSSPGQTSLPRDLGPGTKLKIDGREGEIMDATHDSYYIVYGGGEEFEELPFDTQKTVEILG